MTLKLEHIPHLENLAYNGLMRTKLPDDVAEHFIKHGYARNAVGGLMATSSAQRALIEKGIKPKVWR